MTVEFTAVYREVPEGFIAFVEELPGANTQGATLDEARRRAYARVDLISYRRKDVRRDNARRPAAAHRARPTDRNHAR